MTLRGPELDEYYLLSSVPQRAVYWMCKGTVELWWSGEPHTHGALLLADHSHDAGRMIMGMTYDEMILLARHNFVAKNTNKAWAAHPDLNTAWWQALGVAWALRNVGAPG